MSDESTSLETAVFEGKPEVIWRDVPTIFADAIIGFAFSEDAGRVIFGEVAFNERGGPPVLKPVVTLTATKQGWRTILEHLSAVLKEDEDKPQ